jgi:hypothetical protein
MITSMTEGRVKGGTHPQIHRDGVLVPRQCEFDEYENLRYSLDTTYMEERQTCLNKNTSWI